MRDAILGGAASGQSANAENILRSGFAYALKKVDNKLRRVKSNALYYSDGTCRTVPAPTLGNRVYAYLRENRIKSAVKFLLGMFGTCLWITLTKPYKKTADGRRESWLSVQRELPIFLRKMKSLGMDAFITVKESHLGGGCHVHALIHWKKELKWTERPEYDEKKKKWVKKCRLTSREIRRKIKDCWDGHADIQAVKDEKIGGYLVKELGKFSHVEDSRRRALRQWSKEGDRKFEHRDMKKIWTIYYATSLKIRTVCMSRNIPPEPEEAPPCDLITKMTNPTSKTGKERVLIEILPIPWVIKSQPEYVPKTGDVQKDSPMHRLLEDHRQMMYENGLEKGSTLRERPDRRRYDEYSSGDCFNSELFWKMYNLNNQTKRRNENENCEKH